MVESATRPLTAAGIVYRPLTARKPTKRLSDAIVGESEKFHDIPSDSACSAKFKSKTGHHR